MQEFNESVEQSQSGTQDSSPESANLNSSNMSGEANNQEAVQAAITELEKLGKFKFEGRELTVQDLKKEIMRQKDYTQKTQTLSEERKSFENERKFYSNLNADLRAVEANPKLAAEFIKIYPEKFHVELKAVLNKASGGQSSQPQGQQQNQQHAPIDVEMMSKVQRLEAYFNEQQVAKNEVEIKSQVDALSKKYPDAIPKLAIAEVYDKHLSGEKITPQVWEKAFKQVSEDLTSHYKSRYSTLVEKQTNANKKAQDVDPGGGTPGRAPEKFKSLKDVTNFAVKDLTRKG